MSSDSVTNQIKPKDSISIKLSDSIDPRGFTDSNRVHQSEFNRVLTMIEKRINNATNHVTNNDLIRRHDTISILGSRGSGKTSFLYSILEYLKNDSVKNEGKEISNKNDILVLDFIDPTLIEEKGHIFLTIISLINEKLDEVLSKECNPENESYRDRKNIYAKLRKLSRGLPSIDGIGVNADEKWQDPDYIMDKGIKSVHAAKELEKNFHEYLKEALKILKKKCFILALDDIDIDFLRGWQVIETIRKYLTSPFIITLISGDLRLYSKAIRKQQWKNFGKALLINEGEKLERMPYYNELVTEMEGQYLTKVMRPECRVRLTTLGEKITSHEMKSESKEKIFIEYVTGKPIYIKNAYTQIMRLFGINNNYQADTYISFMLNLPLRTQIRFLNSFTYSEEDTKNNNPAVIDFSPDAFCAEAFISELHDKEIDIDLAMSTPKMMNAIIMKLLLKDEILADAYQLQPTMTDRTLNSALISLSMLFAKKTIDNPHLIFDYFVKVGYPRNLTAILPYAGKNDRNSEIKPSIEGLCRHSGVFKDGVLRDVASSMVSYVRGYYYSIKKKDDNLYDGTIPIYGLAETARGKKPEGRLDKEFENASLLQRHVSYMPASIALFAHKKATMSIYSIYTLFGVIGELLRKDKIEADLSKGFLELSQIRSYKVPNFIDKVTGRDEGEKEKSGSEQIFSNEDDSLDTLTPIMKQWIRRYPKKAISPHLLGKIITRCYYSIQSIESHKFGSLGEYMHRAIIAFMNSVLIEDIKENKEKIGKLNIDNAITSNDRFVANIRVAKSLGFDKLHLSQWLLSCPLFILYLNPKEDLGEYKIFLENIYTKDDIKLDEIIGYSIYEKLCTVKILNRSQNNGKILFSSATDNIGHVIEILAKNIDYNFFMDKDVKEIEKEIGKYFKNGKMTPQVIGKIRDYLKKNPNSQW